MEPLRAARTTDTGPPCVVCRHPLEPEAGKCTECSSFQGEPCIVCGQRLPRTAAGSQPSGLLRWLRARLKRPPEGGDAPAVPSKCTECGSFQSPVRRAMAFSSSTVALLTALLALAAVGTPIVYRMVWPTTSEFLGVRPTATELRVLVKNRTDRPAYVLDAGLAGGPLGPNAQALKLRSDLHGETVDGDHPFASGGHVIFMAPEAFEATRCADEDDRFELHLRLEPRRFWQGQQLELSGIHRFVNGHLKGCTR